MHLNRRQLIQASASASALGLLGANKVTSATTAGQPDEGWFDVSLAQWSSHKELFSGDLDNLGWISSVPKRYGINAVEFVNAFFKDKACDWKYLSQMQTRADDSGVKMLLIMIDGEGMLAAENEKDRKKAIDNHRKWIVAASFLGCHSIRVNAGGSGDRVEMQKRAADSLVQLAEYGKPYKVSVIVENHGGPSSDGAWLAGVMKLANHKAVGTLPDFGNFQTSRGVWYDRYKGVEELMPYAKAVSAKSHEFDDEGNETKTDYKRMMQIVKSAGYRGHVGIEYEGSGHSEEEGILLTKELLLRYRQEIR